jgi:hypothetical protein
MKLSDAMEAGWQGVDQTAPAYQRFYYDYDLGKSKLVAACAIGAACYVVAPEEYPDPSRYNRLFPELKEVLTLEQLAVVPEIDPLMLKPSAPTIAAALVIMNDQLQLSKEKIIATVRQWGY